MVGKTLNSTGRTIYMETSSTRTDSVILALISRSSKMAGNGRIMAITMASTIIGTPISAQGAFPMPADHARPPVATPRRRVMRPPSAWFQAGYATEWSGFPKLR